MSDDGCRCGKPDVAIACSLDEAGLAEQLGGWESVLTHAVARTTLADGALRVALAGVEIGRLAELAAAEHACCPFLAFAVTVDGRGIAVEVRAPADAAEVVTAVFGAPDDSAG